MIVNQTVDLLGALSPSQQALGAQAPVRALDSMSARFDAALLDAAKLVRDNSAGGAKATGLPKIQQALEAALAELSQRPLDQLQALAQKPQLLKQANEALSQAFGLEPKESVLLVSALQRGLESLTQDAPKPLANNLNEVQVPEAESDQPYNMAALSQGVLVPVLVSTRTDGAGGPQTINALSGPLQKNTASADLQDQGIQVTVSKETLQKAEAAKSAVVQKILPQEQSASMQVESPEALSTKTAAQTAVPMVALTGPVFENQIAAANKDKAPALQTTQVDAKAKATADGITVLGREDPAPAVVSKAPVPAPFKELSFEMVAANKPVNVDPASLVTLRSDGTWEIPEQRVPVATVLTEVVPKAKLQTSAAPTVQTNLEPKAAKTAPENQALGTRDLGPVPTKVVETTDQAAVLQSLGIEKSDSLGDMARNTLRQEALRETVFSQVGDALQGVAATEKSRMVIRLKPAQLGEVTVELSLKDGKLSARLIATETEVRDTFIRELAVFKSSLEAAGVAVQDLSVAVKAQAGQDQNQGSQSFFDWRQLASTEKGEQSLPSFTTANQGYSPLADHNLRFSALA